MRNINKFIKIKKIDGYIDMNNPGLLVTSEDIVIDFDENLNSNMLHNYNNLVNNNYSSFETYARRSIFKAYINSKFKANQSQFEVDYFEYNVKIVADKLHIYFT